MNSHWINSEYSLFALFVEFVAGPWWRLLLSFCMFEHFALGGRMRLLPAVAWRKLKWQDQPENSSAWNGVYKKVSHLINQWQGPLLSCPGQLKTINDWEEESADRRRGKPWISRCKNLGAESLLFLARRKFLRENHRGRRGWRRTWWGGWGGRPWLRMDYCRGCLCIRKKVGGLHHPHRPQDDLHHHHRPQDDRQQQQQQDCL